MAILDKDGRFARVSRVLMFGFLILALLGSTGVVADGDGTKDGDTCPALIHERGSENAPERAFERSAHGRSIALIASGCQPPADTPSGR